MRVMYEFDVSRIVVDVFRVNSRVGEKPALGPECVCERGKLPWVTMKGEKVYAGGSPFWDKTSM